MSESPPKSLENFMSPFGKVLGRMMFDANIKQKDLALAIGLSQAHFSSILSGRKNAPGDATVDRIIKYLHLSEFDAANLREAASCSVRGISIPSTASVEEYQLSHELNDRIGKLQPCQVAAIREILRFGS